MKHKVKWLGVSLLTACILGSQVQAATLDLFFYDESNKKVGAGQVAYDENKSIAVQDPDSSSGYSTLKNPITSFSVLVQSEGWLSDNIDRWWSAAGQQSGQGPTGRTGSLTYGSWFFGDSVMGTSQFVMFFSQSSNNGRWIQSISPNPQNPDGLFGTGTWSTSELQTAVPLPAAIGLFSWGLIPLFLLKLKRKTYN